MKLHSSIKEQLTHELLLMYMPFDCGWLNTEDDKPEPNSVMVATALSAVVVASTGIMPKVYTN